MESKANNKIIHYIWFGGNPISELTKKCIQTWKKFLPDFEIKEWNETNFDVNQCPFVKEAYAQKKWAFVADYTRFKVLEEYGGIYLDTDMEITADISKYLELDLFMGQEDSKMINAAVVWAKDAHNPRIKDIVDYYESCEKFNPTGDLYDQSVPRVLTKYFEQIGFDMELDKVQSFDDGKTKIYPMEYFYPLSYDYQNNKFTDNSCMIHHFDATWISPMEKFKTKMKRKNMAWVVYVIDFFIAVKNKIKFFSNPKDLITFLTMFLLMICSLLALRPCTQVSTLANVFNSSFSVSVLQILGTSLLWTFICAKIRNMDYNFFSDKLLGRKQEDIDEGLVFNVKMNTEQEIKAKKRVNILFAIEYIITILVSFFPVFQIATIIPTGSMWYALLFIINVYMFYVGVNKKFKYRILELIPYGIILGLLVISNFSSGLLVSLVTFGFVAFSINKNNKTKKKRIITFVASYVVAMIVALLICGIGQNVFSNIAFSSDLATESTIEQATNYLTDETVVTQFNYIKEYVSSSIINISNVGFLVSPVLYLVLSSILTCGLTAITKNKNYLFLIALFILNSIQLVVTGINFGYINVLMLAVMLLVTVQKGIVKILDK